MRYDRRIGNTSLLADTGGVKNGKYVWLSVPGQAGDEGYDLPTEPNAGAEGTACFAAALYEGQGTALSVPSVQTEGGSFKS